MPQRQRNDSALPVSPERLAVFRQWYESRFATQVQAAKALGVSQSIVSDFLGGKQGIGGPLLAGILRQDPDMAAVLVGAPSPRQVVVAITRALGDEFPHRAREAAAKIAVAIRGEQTPLDELTLAARGFLGVAELVGGYRSVDADAQRPTRRTGRQR